MTEYFSFLDNLADELMEKDKLDFTKKEDVDKLHDVIKGLKSFNLFNTFFGDEYNSFLDSLQEYADKTYEESHKETCQAPEKPSDKLKNDVMKNKLEKLTSEYIDEVIKPNAKLTDEQLESVLSGLFEFACWIYNR